MDIPTTLYASNDLDRCVKAGKEIHSLRFILEPLFFTKEMHCALLANHECRRDVDFSLLVFDDYGENLNHYFHKNIVLKDGFIEIAVFNLISRVSAFCQQIDLERWYKLLLAKRYVDDLVKLYPIPKNGLQELNKFSQLAQLTLSGLHPYYEVSFPLPLALPIDSGTYILSSPDINYFKVRHFKDSERNSMFGDRNFSQVTIAFWGILETIQIADLDLSKCISLVNEIMTTAKLIDENLRVFMLDQHNLYSYQVTQYRPDGILIRKHLPVSQLTTLFALANDDEEVNTHQKISDTSKVITQLKTNSLLIQDRLYASALIDKGNNNYTSAFYQLNSSIESLITHSLRSVFSLRNKLFEFEKYMYGDQNKVPNNFDQLKELRKQINLVKQNSMSIRDCKKLESYLKIIKGHDKDGYLRNRLVHGAEHQVDKDTLTKSFEAYKNLKALLTKIIEKLT